MAKFHEEWTVQPHGPLEPIGERMLTVAGEIRMPLGNFPRRMTVIGTAGKRTAIWSAIPLREAEMATIERLGAPAFLIVPGIAHRLDLKAWKARYPKARVICAPGARAAVEEIVAVDATEDILGDPTVRFEAVPGVEEKEAALIVHRGGETVLLLNDILANVRHPDGIGAHIMARLMGFGTDRPKIPWLGRRMFVKDERALAQAFRRWAREPDLKRIVVSHGDVIEAERGAVLDRLAAELAG